MAPCLDRTITIIPPLCLHCTCTVRTLCPHCIFTVYCVWSETPKCSTSKCFCHRCNTLFFTSNVDPSTNCRGCINSQFLFSSDNFVVSRHSGVLSSLQPCLVWWCTSVPALYSCVPVYQSCIRCTSPVLCVLKCTTVLLCSSPVLGVPVYQPCLVYCHP